MQLDVAPPVRIVAVITLFASTLDLFADFLMSYRLYQQVPKFTTTDGTNAVYAYWFFTFVSVLVYTAEMVDVFITLKNDQEIPFYTKLAKSMVIALEEVPLPICLYVIIVNEGTYKGVSGPALWVSCIKLVALTWGITKFIKLKFCWPCLPCSLDHGWHENVHRCFTFTLYRIVMIIVNLAHLFSIIIVIINLINSSKYA